MTFGSMIRSLRKQNKLTQAMLADQIGITDKAVSKWERDISYPDISLFPKLADVLGVTIDDLLKTNDEETSSRLIQIFEMSHDIRTPLNIILGYTELAKKFQDDPEKISQYLNNIELSGKYLLDVIDHLMEVAHFEGKQELKEKGTSLSDPFGQYDFSGKRVLLVEDNDLNRELAKEILKHTGIEVEFAEDGLKCIQKLQEKEPGYYDLILMDILMPNLDGIEATRRIRKMKDPMIANIPIVAMTANVYNTDRKRALEAGMNDFTGKPIVISNLYETMEKYL
ncbi:MAG: response regulator [Solobacterium sp.]|nr:response regulator [Solobacterium sp.]